MNILETTIKAVLNIPSTKLHDALTKANSNDTQLVLAIAADEMNLNAPDHIYQCVRLIRRYHENSDSETLRMLVVIIFDSCDDIDFDQKHQYTATRLNTMFKEATEHVQDHEATNDLIY